MYGKTKTNPEKVKVTALQEKMVVNQEVIVEIEMAEVKAIEKAAGGNDPEAEDDGNKHINKSVSVQ